MKLPWQLWTQKEIAAHFGVAKKTVGTWRRRYDDFPIPATHIDGWRPVWDPAAVKLWWERTQRAQAGRRRQNRVAGKA